MMQHTLNPQPNVACDSDVDARRKNGVSLGFAPGGLHYFGKFSDVAFNRNRGFFSVEAKDSARKSSLHQELSLRDAMFGLMLRHIVRSSQSTKRPTSIDIGADLFFLQNAWCWFKRT